MRVLHLGKYYPPVYGGMESFLQLLATELAKQGVIQQILVHDTGLKTRHERLGAHGESIELIRAACIGRLFLVPISLVLPWLLYRAMRSFKPDVCHIHMPNLAGLLLLFMPKRCKWLVHWHADVEGGVLYRLLYPVYRYFEQALLKRAEAIIVTSSEYAMASKALARWHNKLVVIPLACEAANEVGTCDLTKAKALWPGENLRVLALGRMVRYKGFDILLDAMAKTSAISLVLAGDGPCRKALEAQADKLGLRDRVHFAGAVDEANKKAFLQACDVFCLPSRNRLEAFGIVLLEAMSAGKPAICSDLEGSGMRSVIDPGVTGQYFKSGDAQSLSKALSEANENQVEWQAMGVHAREAYQRHYRIEKIANSIMQLYSKLVGELKGA